MCDDMDDQAESAVDAGEPHQRISILLAAIMLLAGASGARAAEEKHPPKPPYMELELKMFGLVNADRTKHKKSPLKYDNALATIGRGHSADMLKNKFFHHKSPTTGMIGDRLFAAKEMVMASGENLAMDQSIDDAEKALMKSPGHRKNILQQAFTHCGVGIVQAPNGTYYMTQVFATRPPPVKLKTLAPDVIKALNLVRAIQGKHPFKVNAKLNKIAAQHVADVARAGKPVAADIRARVKAAGVKIKLLSFGLLMTWDPNEFASAGALLKPKKGRIGMAFARNKKHKGLGYGVIWAYVIFTDE